MTFKLALAGAASALLFGASASAQTTGADPTTPGQAAQQGGAAAGQAGDASARAHQFTDRQLRAFAQATTQLQQNSEMSAEQTVQTVESSGLSVEEYNAIAEAATNDPAVMESVRGHMQSDAPPQ